MERQIKNAIGKFDFKANFKRFCTNALNNSKSHFPCKASMEKNRMSQVFRQIEQNLLAGKGRG